MIIFSITLTSEPLLTVLADITKIQNAIRNGLSDEVEALLGQMTCAEVTDCFTTTYGLGIDRPDDDGLYQGATPILHAARSGNPDVFSSVIRTMRAKLGPQQVRYTMDVTTYSDVVIH